MYYRTVKRFENYCRISAGEGYCRLEWLIDNHRIKDYWRIEFQECRITGMYNYWRAELLKSRTNNECRPIRQNRTALESTTTGVELLEILRLKNLVAGRKLIKTRTERAWAHLKDTSTESFSKPSTTWPNLGLCTVRLCIHYLSSPESLQRGNHSFTDNPPAPVPKIHLKWRKQAARALYTTERTSKNRLK